MIKELVSKEYGDRPTSHLDNKFQMMRLDNACKRKQKTRRKEKGTRRRTS
jgi:hypothetical protein